MKFSAGYFERRRKVWRQRFAFYPIRIHDTWIWLEWYWFKGDTICFARARSEEEKANPYSLIGY